jgi:uncharacterized damage-inducible protein DinB
MMLLAGPLISAACLQAQSNPMSADTKAFYTSVKNNIMKAAEKMPEENYSFKPSPDVRNFGKIIGHIADNQYGFCGAVKGEEKNSDLENTKTSKADLVAGLKDAFAYCDAVYDGLTDATAADKVKFFGRDRTKIIMLNINTGHNNEHYGNIATYMRIKGVVPPSSEPRK